MLLDTPSSLPTDEIYNRNFIDGQWVFPGAPYEYEIRNPVDSTITAVVPLSSRNDVGRAIAAAHRSQDGLWADTDRRNQLLTKLLIRLAELAPDLSRLQSMETGLAQADSAATIDAALRLARTILTRAVIDKHPLHPGVSGHVLSWGLPFTEMLANVFGAWTQGKSVVVKPSLRGPLSPVVVALAASHVGFPPGVLNVVQGTGVDVGAALISSSTLARLHVHGNDNTLSRGRRATPRTHVPLSTLSAGGNAAIVYPDIAPDRVARLAGDIAAAVRMNSAGGPFGLPIIALHSTVASQVLEAIVGEATSVLPAPLPTEPLRRRAMGRLDVLRAGGARVLAGATIPDDVEHRMGWRIPATVLDLGNAERAAPLLRAAAEPLGPILTVVSWDSHQDLDLLFAAQRHLDGYASTWGDSVGDERIRFGVVTGEQSPLDAAFSGLLPSAWIGDTSDPHEPLTNIRKCP
ncbi:aldehyde dehydrogenase family protein [Mycobacterium sp. AT1]|uniref:aldehyde dehydrogenase family protein n=1 Tax=Mycobacterium sp. AT1 TaxID=1961706 RepID=UPI0009AE2D25|nr:aldehyde dehydrogenase family protein [Mycobacterium sp. AT1]OPX05309.1 aldehyde dehydrogenase [Mycobacterium sp. AT1]